MFLILLAVVHLFLELQRPVILLLSSATKKNILLVSVPTKKNRANNTLSFTGWEERHQVKHLYCSNYASHSPLTAQTSLMLSAFPALTGCSSATSHTYAELPVLGVKDKSRPTSVPPEATVAGCRWIWSGLLWHTCPRWASSAREALQEQLGSSWVHMSSSLTNSPVFIAWGHKVCNNIETCHPHKYLCHLCKGL